MYSLDVLFKVINWNVQYEMYMVESILGVWMGSPHGKNQWGNNTGLMGRPNGWWYCDGNIHKSIDGYINHLVCNHLSAEMFWGRIDICICLIFSHFLITGKHWHYWPFVRGIHWSGINYWPTGPLWGLGNPLVASGFPSQRASRSIVDSHTWAQ